MEILDQPVLWGLPVWRLLVALLIIFLGFLSRRIIKALFTGFLKRRALKTSVTWDDDTIELLPSPLALVTQVGLWFLALAFLMLPEEPVDIRAFVKDGLMVALSVAVTWVLFRVIDVAARLSDRAAEKTDTRLDDQVIPLLRKTLKVFLSIVIAVSVIQELGHSVTSLIASLGIGGLALALAARDTVANFFGSVVVFTDQPFHIGDWVEFGDVEGIVEEVGFRTTRVRRFDKSMVLVPNQTFTSTPITNHSVRPKRRLMFTVGLTYETSAEQLELFIARMRKRLAEDENLDQESPAVYFKELGESSLDVLIIAFTLNNEWGNFMQVQEQLLLDIMRIVDELGLELAFPTQTIYMRDEQWGHVLSHEENGSSHVESPARTAG